MEIAVKCLSEGYNEYHFVERTEHQTRVRLLKSLFTETTMCCVNKKYLKVFKKKEVVIKNYLSFEMTND